MKKGIISVVIIIMAVIPLSFSVAESTGTETNNSSLEHSFGIGFDSYGLPGYDTFGLSFKKYFNNIFGLQLFLSPKFYSGVVIDVGIGISPIFNLFTFKFGDIERGSKLLFQFILETLYVLTYNTEEGAADHLISFVPSIGFEFFFFSRLSIGYKIGYGFVYKFISFTDNNWKADFKRPNSLQNILLYFPLCFYF